MPGARPAGMATWTVVPSGVVAWSVIPGCAPGGTSSAMKRCVCVIVAGSSPTMESCDGAGEILQGM